MISLKEMRVLFTYFILFSVQSIFGQAHIGDSFEALQARYPEKRLIMYYNNEGTLYTKIPQDLGVFEYYFQGIKPTIFVCYQEPYDQFCLKKQIEYHNTNHLILNENLWRAHLENGTVYNIQLEYNKDLSTFIFKYYLVST